MSGHAPKYVGPVQSTSYMPCCGITFFFMCEKFKQVKTNTYCRRCEHLTECTGVVPAQIKRPPFPAQPPVLKVTEVPQPK